MDKIPPRWECAGDCDNLLGNLLSRKKYFYSPTKRASGNEHPYVLGDRDQHPAKDHGN